MSSLGYIRDPRALPAVLACAYESDAKVAGMAIDALADLGGDEAVAALQALTADPEHRPQATAALEWLTMPRTVDAIIANLPDTELSPKSRTPFEWIRILAEADDLRALEALTRMMDRVRDDIYFPASAIVAAVARSMTVPEREQVLRDWAASGGPLGASTEYIVSQAAPDQIDPARKAADAAARTVPRSAMRHAPVSEPITDLVTKFGGQPVWRDAPQWPLSAGIGLPMTFFGQVRLPSEVAGDGTWMAYVFFAPEGRHDRWDGGDNALVVQPGPGPAAVDTIAQATGPTITTPLHDGPGRYRTHWRKVLQEYAIELEPGLDPETWSDDVSEDSHGDWDKVGGTACWLQGAEVPAGATFAFQFTPSAFGCELGDGAEAYAFVGRDGRGAWLWQCH